MQTRWYTAREIAGLPGMPSSEFRTREKLARLVIPSRQRQGRTGGGGLEYDSSALPADTRAALAARYIEQASERAAQAIAAPVATPDQAQAQLPQTAAEPPVPAAPDLPTLRQPPSDTQARCADARMQLLYMAAELSAQTGSIKRAYQQLAAKATLAGPGDELRAIASAANQRRATLSARTLEGWAKARREGGWHALLPTPAPAQPLVEVGADVALALGMYFSRDPKFRNLTYAAREAARQLGMARDDVPAFYSRCRRAVAKTDNVQAIKARHSGAARAALLPFKRRDTSVLKPNDVWLIDGHAYKAKVRHPDHGQPFRPELTVAIDAATRRIQGWSVNYSENVIAVGDCMRHAIGQCGVPAILYSDNGGGETAKQIDCPVDGFCARLGIDHRTGLPGHPQGHGLIERSWRTHAINSARQWGSFLGSDADPGEYRKAAARIAKEQRALEAARKRGDAEVIVLDTKLLPSWEMFVDHINAIVADYNAHHRHSSLPKRADGKYMTPDEAWAAMVQPGDLHMLSELEQRALFRPSALRTAQRGEVKFSNNIYYAPELMRRDVDRQQVSVRYDIHDPHTVEIYTLSGEFVCQAKWGGNRMDYYPKPVVERAKEKRVRATIKRREQQIDAALRELNPTLAEQPAASLPAPGLNAGVPLMPTGQVRQARSALAGVVIDVQATEAGAAADARPMFFASPSERYEWLMAHREQWTDTDSRWLDDYTSSEDYAALADYYASRGLGWEEGGNGFRGAQAAGGAAA